MSTSPKSKPKPKPNRGLIPRAIDAFFIIFTSAALAIFLLWTASRTIGNNSFEILPDWLGKSYNAIWVSLASAGTGVGFAIYKGLTDKTRRLFPNYLIYVLIVTFVMLGFVYLLRYMFANPNEPSIATNSSNNVSGIPVVPTEEIVININSRDNLTYVRIPPGPFIMGCSATDSDCDRNEMPPHPVRITRGFWLGQTVVTQMAYQHVTKTNPSFSKGDQKPVENITWFEARDYCNAVGMRLPTEAEWEYAARAGVEELPRYGDIDSIAWYQDNSGRQTHEVMKKTRNNWKLYDMLGNVWQWTSDWYELGYYKQLSLRAPTEDPQGPTSSPNYYRSLRGGGCFSLQTDVRFSSRYKTHPEQRGHDVGFRCAGPVLP